MLLPKTNRSSTLTLLTGRNVQLSNLLISSCYLWPRCHSLWCHSMANVFVYIVCYIITVLGISYNLRV